jgi:hypothetical protein
VVPSLGEAHLEPGTEARIVRATLILQGRMTMMLRSIGGIFIRSYAVFFTSAMIASTYGASSTPSYTITDLGLGTATLSNATGANATLTGPDGTVYSFPRTSSEALPSNVTWPAPPSYLAATYGTALVNANGIVAVPFIEVYTAEGDTDNGLSGIMYYQLHANGTLGPVPQSGSVPQTGLPVNLLDGYYSTLGGYPAAQVLGLNNANQLLRGRRKTS